jgi:hypothetical protein
MTKRLFLDSARSAYSYSFYTDKHTSGWDVPVIVGGARNGFTRNEHGFHVTSLLFHSSFMIFEPTDQSFNHRICTIGSYIHNHRICTPFRWIDQVSSLVALRSTVRERDNLIACPWHGSISLNLAHRPAPTRASTPGQDRSQHPPFAADPVNRPKLSICTPQLLLLETCTYAYPTTMIVTFSTGRAATISEISSVERSTRTHKGDEMQPPTRGLAASGLRREQSNRTQQSTAGPLNLQAQIRGAARV